MVRKGCSKRQESVAAGAEAKSSHLESQAGRERLYSIHNGLKLCNLKSYPSDILLLARLHPLQVHSLPKQWHPERTKYSSRWNCGKHCTFQQQQRDLKPTPLLRNPILNLTFPFAISLSLMFCTSKNTHKSTHVCLNGFTLATV